MRWVSPAVSVKGNLIALGGKESLSSSKKSQVWILLKNYCPMKVVSD
mgnify:CR=1 FL=1